MTSPPRIVESQDDLAGFLGVSRRTVSEYLAKGMPGSPGRYVVPACIAWVLCFGPRRSEQARNDYLWTHIRRLDAGHDSAQ